MTSERRSDVPAFSRRIGAALLAAFVVALTAQTVATLAFFVGVSTQAGALEATGAFFLPAALLLFVLLALAAAAGAFRLRWVAGLTTLITALIAVLVSTFAQVTASGTALTSDVVGTVFGVLTGAYLVFLVAAVVAGITWGPRVYQWVARWDESSSSTTERRIALVRAPADNLADGLTTHIDRVEIDSELASEQWEQYVDALEQAGWRTEEVERGASLADSVFVEDAMVLFGDVAVIANPGVDSRKPETAAVERVATEMGLRIERIVAPGTLDGGDVLKVGATVYVGRGGRTNAEGVRQLRSLLHPLGFRVVAVPLTKVLHLKSAVTALPDGTVIGFAPLVDDPAIFDRFLAMPEEGGAHVVVLGPDTVLMAASAPRSAAVIADLGYRVITVDISEFEKLEGCVTCLSVRVR